MSKETVVSSYMQERFNKIEKDLFLEEIANLSKNKQKDALIEEISAMEDYIKIIKNNRECYITLDQKKILKADVKKYLTYLRKIIKKYQEYYKYLNLLEYYEDKNQRIDKKIEFESSYIILTSNQIEMLNELDITNINNYDLNDLTHITKYLIQQFDVSKIAIIKLILDKVEKEFIGSNYNENNFIELSSIKNILTYKINCLDKDDNNRKLLKEIKKYVKSIINLSKEKEIRNHEYRIDIINILLEEEVYLYKIITRCPKFLNLLDEENHTFAYTLMTKYLDLYLLELQGKQSKIPKEKYLRMYYALSQSPDYLYKEIDQVEIEILFNHFKEMIKNGNFKRKKYLEVSNVLSSILNKKNDCKKFSEDIINFEQENILRQNVCGLRKKLQDEYAFIITDSNSKLYNHAYSIKKGEYDNYILRLHVTDISTFIQKGSCLDSILKEVMFIDNDNWLEEDLLNKFSLGKDKEMPVITLECEIKDKEISNFKCYKSSIMVDDIYLFEDFNKKQPNKKMLECLKLGYVLNKNLDNNNYGKSLVETFDRCFFHQIGNYFMEHKYPYIYKIQQKQNNDNYIKLLEELNGLFGKIDKEDANIFYSIICDDTNYSKYSLIPNYYSESNQKYYTDLLVPLYSYIGIYLQYLLDDFIIKTDIDKDILKENYKKEIKDLINLANEKKEEKRLNKQKKLKI